MNGPKIRCVRTIGFCDGILPAESRDSAGATYIGSMVEQGDAYDRYLPVKCPAEEIRLFRHGGRDKEVDLQRTLGQTSAWAAVVIEILRL